MIDYTSIGRKIKFYRTKCNKTQASLAEELEVSSKYISALERGVSSLSLKKLEALASHLNVEVVDILADSSDRSRSYGIAEIEAMTKDWTVDQKKLLIDLVRTLNKHL